MTATGGCWGRPVNSRLPDVLIPAAGGSTRLGHPKQLVQIEGRSLIRRAAALALSLDPARIHVVLGAHRERIEAELAGLHGLCIHHNPRWPEGMAGSLAVGLQQVRPDCPAVLVLLPDQARVTASDLQPLIAAWHDAPGQPVAAAYAGTFGVPAILPRTLFAGIMALTGDRGARAVLTAHRDELATVSMPNAAFDLDTPEDEHRLRNGRSSRGLLT